MLVKPSPMNLGIRMFADRRSSFRVPTAPTKPEVADNRRRSLRNAPNEDVQILTPSPSVLVPNLRTNIEGHSLRNAKRSSDTMKLPPKSPRKKLCVRNLSEPDVLLDSRSNDIRDNDKLKSTFLSALDLVRKPLVKETAEDSVETAKLPITLEQKLKSRKTHVVSFFKNNPVPLSSSLGKNVVLKAGFGKCQNPRDEVIRYDRQCNSLKHRASNTAPSWPHLNVRKFTTKPGQYVHKYSFSKQQRIQRHVELVVGLNQKCFPLLNACGTCSVRLYRMSDQEVALAMTNLLTGQSKEPASDSKKVASSNELRWIASEPTAGPSRGVERLGTPVVKLYDIKNSPSKSKYLLKNKLD